MGFPTDRTFPQKARDAFLGAEQQPEIDCTYDVRPGNPLYNTFLTFLGGQLENLQKSGINLSTVPARLDSGKVIEELINYLRTQSTSLTTYNGWGDHNHIIDSFFRDSNLEVCKDELEGGKGFRRIGYALDLFTVGENNTPGGFHLERRIAESRNDSVFLESNGSFKLFFHNGRLRIDLDSHAVAANYDHRQ